MSQVLYVLLMVCLCLLCIAFVYPAWQHPQIQTKSSKYIKYLCAEDKPTLLRWVTGCRIAKYGRLIKDNYDNLMRDIVEEDLETLAHARSFSICSMAKTLAAVSPDSGSPELASPSSDQPDGPRTSQRRGSADSDSGLTITASDFGNSPSPKRKHSGLCRKESMLSSGSGSGGGPSERSDTATPTDQQIAFFDADVPVGTIKRKPSMTPKIPLTNTTRTLAKQSSAELPDSAGIYDTVGRKSGSLGRMSGARMSLRRSQTDEKISASALGTGTLSRNRQGSLPRSSNARRTSPPLSAEETPRNMSPAQSPLHSPEKESLPSLHSAWPAKLPQTSSSPLQITDSSPKSPVTSSPRKSPSKSPAVQHRQMAATNAVAAPPDSPPSDRKSVV